MVTLPENSGHQLGCQSLSTRRLRVTPKVSTMDLLVLRETDELSAGGGSGGLCDQRDRGAALRSRKTLRRPPTRVWHNGEWRHRSSPLSVRIRGLFRVRPSGSMISSMTKRL